jgi:hypothetical protein
MLGVDAAQRRLSGACYLGYFSGEKAYANRPCNQLASVASGEKVVANRPHAGVPEIGRSATTFSPATKVALCRYGWANLISRHQ